MYVLKSYLVGSRLRPVLHRVLPEAHRGQVHLHSPQRYDEREIVYYRLKKRISFLRLNDRIHGIHPKIFWYLKRKQYEILKLPFTEKEFAIASKTKHLTEIMCYNWWLKSQWLYLERQKTGPPAPSLKYEDLINDPVKYTSAVFKYCGLSLDLLPKALTAIHKDSQRGSRLARENFATEGGLSVFEDENFLAIARELGAEIGFNVTEDFHLSNDILSWV